MSQFSDQYAVLGIDEEALLENGDNLNSDGEAGTEDAETAPIATAGGGVSSGGCAGCASWSEFRDKALKEERAENRPQMGPILFAAKRPPAIHITTRDNKEFRVYMRSDIWVSPREINQLCRFLDTRDNSQKVEFMLGVDMLAEQSNLIGPIVSSIQNCAAQTFGNAMGLCSLPETIIWLFCKYRTVQRYGTITFTKPSFIKVVPEYEYYYQVAFNRAIDLGLITEAQKEDVFKRNGDIVIMRDKWLAYVDAMGEANDSLGNVTVPSHA